MKSKKLKQLVATVIIATTVAATIPDAINPTAAFAITDVTYPTAAAATTAGFQVALVGDKYQITRYTGSSTNVTIPSKINNISVTSIGSTAFQSCSGLTSISIPSRVTSIGNSAFLGCSGLTSISIPSSVTSIGVFAFDNINNGAIFYVPNDAIKNLLSQKGYPKANTNQKIINALQANITSVTDIADNGDGRDLQVKFDKAFNEISVSSYRVMAVKADKAATFDLAKANAVAVANYTTVTKTGANITKTLATGAKDTDGAPIVNGQAYKIFVLSVASGTNATVNVLSEASTEIILQRLTYPSVSAAQTAGFTFTTVGGNYQITGYTGSSTNITIPSQINGKSVTSIGDSAFKNCSRLTTITIPNSVTSIGAGAFYGCSKLTTITIPNGVTSIGNDTFENCSELISIIIPDSVTSIGLYAFQNCYKLTTITIPNRVTSIGGNAFSFCSELTTITIPNSVTSIGDTAFRNCSKLTTITIPNSVISIGRNAFFYINSGAIIYVSNEGIKQLLSVSGYPGGTNQKVINVLQANITSVTDVADNGDGRDLQVVFNKAVDESLVSSYRIMAVKANKAATFDLAQANTVTTGNYTTTYKTGDNITQTLAEVAKDTDGDQIVNGQTYKIFVLSVADGTNATVNVLSAESAEIKLQGTPSITTSPSNSTITEGTGTSFAVVAEGTGITYQWQVDKGTGSGFENVSNDTIYSGATTNTLSIRNAPVSMSGYKYKAVVSRSASSSATSNSATLTVNAAAVAPSIVTNPIDKTIVAGGSTTFAVSASGTGLTYQWQVDMGSGFTDITDSTVCSGATTNTLSITGAPALMNGYKYRAVVTGTGALTATSNSATLTVNAAAVAPSIVTNPTDKTIVAGGSTTFAVSASGTGLTYQWQVDMGSGFTDITDSTVCSGATTNTLSITGAPALMNGYKYRAVVTGTGALTATSNSAMLTVNAAAVAPSIVTNPTDKTIVAGGNTTFAVSASGTSLTYQWQVDKGTGSGFENVSNDTIYSGATTNTLSIGNAPVSMSGYKYKAVVSRSASSSATSNSATLTVNAAAVAPSIVTNPIDKTIVAGGSTTFAVSASGTGLTYQWQVDMGSGFTDITDSTVCSGATTNTLSITGAPALMNGYKYRAVVTGTGALTATSNSATLTVNAAAVAPSIVTNPIDKTIVAGGSTTFAVSASGTGLTYQWQVDMGSGFTDITDSTVCSGATTNTLSITGASALMNRYKYRAVVTGTGALTATSNSATLTVNAAAVAPSIVTNPIDKTIVAGGSTTFAVSASGTGLTYQWQVDMGSGFTDITDSTVCSGATTNTLSITGAPALMNGYKYRAVVTGTGALTATSNSATLTVNAAAVAPSIVTNPIDKTIVVGGSTTFAVSASGTSLTYQWQVDKGTGSGFEDVSNDTIYSGATTNTLSIANAPVSMSGYKYKVVVSGTTGSQVTSNSAVLTVNAALVVPAVNNVIVNPTTASVMQGETKQLAKTVNAVGGAAETVNWSNNDASGKVVINSNGLVSVASDAIPGEYIIIATSTFDSSKTGTATITVTTPEAVTYTLNYEAGAGGRVEGSSSQTVTGGEDGTEVTAVPNSGYYFAGWSDGNSNASRQDTNVDRNINVSAGFELDLPTNTTPAAVRIIGTVQVNNTLEAQLIDMDGMNVTTSAAVTYKWYRIPREDSDGGTLIGEDKTYRLVSDDIGSYIKLVVSYIDEAFERITSKILGEPSNNTNTSSHKTSNSTSENSTQQITVKVTDGSSDNSVSQTVIERITASDGSKKDTVTYTADKARETIAALTSAGKDTARIVAADSDVSVAETRVNIPKETLSALSSGNVNLEIETNGAIVSLPKESVQGLAQSGELNGDLYFRLVPIKDATKQTEIKTTAAQQAVVRVVSGNNGVQVLGTPVAIETNMSQRAVDIVLPLKGITIPTDPTERQAFLKDLGVFIEHSDGEKVLEKGEIVEYSQGVFGIKFTVNKFSDFTIVKLNNSNQTGWKKDNGEWYFLNNNGTLASGWHKAESGEWTYQGKDTKGTWFYLGTDYKMNTGWFKDTDGSWYFLCDGKSAGALGAMETGWKLTNGKWYFLKDNGSMATGWTQVDGKWYYLQSDGSMASNTIVDGYTLDNSGAWVN